MPAKSKAQYRFMEAVAHGGIKKKGLSQKQAKEYVSGQKYKGLPAKAKKAKKK
jgi:hypothetical protein